MATNQQMDSEPTPASAPANAAAVDEKLYSRQLYVMGHEAQRRMMASRAVLVGLSGLGAEVAKNIVLAGIAGVTLVDPLPANGYDLGGNFYLGEGDVGGTRGRAETCAGRLAELNEYVKVDVASDVTSLGDEEALLGLVAGASVVVVTVPLPTALLTKLDEKCRSSGVCFIYSLSTGVFGQVFCDFGDEFTVTDKDGEFQERSCHPALFLLLAWTGMPMTVRRLESRIVLLAPSLCIRGNGEPHDLRRIITGRCGRDLRLAWRGKILARNPRTFETWSCTASQSCRGRSFGGVSPARPALPSPSRPYFLTVSGYEDRETPAESLRGRDSGDNPCSPFDRSTR